MLKIVKVKVISIKYLLIKNIIFLIIDLKEVVLNVLLDIKNSFKIQMMLYVLLPLMLYLIVILNILKIVNFMKISLVLFHMLNVINVNQEQS